MSQRAISTVLTELPWLECGEYPDLGNDTLHTGRILTQQKVPKVISKEEGVRQGVLFWALRQMGWLRSVCYRFGFTALVANDTSMNLEWTSPSSFA